MAKATKKPQSVAAIEDAKERKKALDKAISDITKEHGQGAIMRLGENTGMNVSAVSTGSFTLDMALGIGGLPRGRVIEIFGPESSGKTTVALHCVAEIQKIGGSAAFIDVEHALDPIYAKALGVDIDDLLVSQPDYGEQALDIADALVRSGAIDVIVIDSVAALAPKDEIEGTMGANHVGKVARLMSQALRKLSGSAAKTNCVLIFINQIREKIGVAYGNPETTPGGRALKFAASVRIDVRKAEPLKEGTEVKGNHVKCKVVKNKVAPPFKVAEFDILYGKGINKAGEVIDLALEFDIVEKSGSWFSYNGERIGQGKEKVRALFDSDPELMAELEAKVKAAMMEGAATGNPVAMLDEDEDDFEITLAEDFTLDE